MGVRRTSVDVNVDILESALNGANKTRIVYRSNLNFAIVRNYLDNLIKSGLLIIGEDGLYVTTNKGAKFIKDYQNLMKPFNFS
ncbi:transcriptional regulator [Candidatus Bathyarchaeota archaeon]|nr:transcriptional regulator [Candidatus Bathyarchaeota archaeon]